MHLRSLVTLTLLFGSLTHVACDDEEPPVKPLAEGIVEVGGGEARVRIALDPFRVEILDVAGSVVLESASPGAEDAYGAATGTLDEPIFAPQVLPGWDGYRPGEQPWRSARKARVVERAPSSVALLAEGNGVRIRYEVAVAGARVSLRLKTEEVAGAAPVNKTAMAFLSPQDEHFFGMGERFASTNHRGFSLDTQDPCSCIDRLQQGKRCRTSLAPNADAFAVYHALRGALNRAARTYPATARSSAHSTPSCWRRQAARSMRSS